jgi:hypothetical protein
MNNIFGFLFSSFSSGFFKTVFGYPQFSTFVFAQQTGERACKTKRAKSNALTNKVCCAFNTHLTTLSQKRKPAAAIFNYFLHM